MIPADPVLPRTADHLACNRLATPTVPHPDHPGHQAPKPVPNRYILPRTAGYIARNLLPVNRLAVPAVPQVPTPTLTLDWVLAPALLHTGSYPKLARGSAQRWRLAVTHRLWVWEVDGAADHACRVEGAHQRHGATGSPAGVARGDS